MRITGVSALAVLLATVGSVSAAENTAGMPKFEQTNLVANKAKYTPEIVDKKLINAWGIAIRPAGAGGHFWVTGKDISFEYVGDVKKSVDEKMKKLHVDDLPYVKLPVGGDENFSTGVVFVDSKENFVITQKLANGEEITTPSKFIFASDGGIISAWTEKKNPDGTFKRADYANPVIDESKEGAQFFGLAINSGYNRIYAADFGQKPTIKTFDGQFKPLDIKFDQPFDDNKNGQVDAGEYAPFNIQNLPATDGKTRLFVAYAKTQACPQEEVEKKTCEKGALFVGEEDTSKAGYGRIAEFNEDGKLIRVLNDGGKLSAPWGLAIAPESYGPLAGALLVANFGDGTIPAYDLNKNAFIDVLKTTKGKPVVIDKIWGLLFGNGESLGDKDALYFAAGPEDEADGIFGSLRLAK